MTRIKTVLMTAVCLHPDRRILPALVVQAIRGANKPEWVEDAEDLAVREKYGKS